MFDHLSVAVGGVIEISNNIMIDLVNGNLSPVASWVTMGALVVGSGAFSIYRDQRRRTKGLVVPPASLSALKIAASAAGGVVLALICNANRAARGAAKPVEGVPWAVPTVLVVLAVTTFVLQRTRFGRYVYAIGGNSEAARRAGVNVTLVRTVAFGLCSLMAGIAGLMYLSWLGSIATDIDPNQLMYAIAAAVIGGTSLLGGRGKPLHALLGGLVIRCDSQRPRLDRHGCCAHLHDHGPRTACRRHSGRDCTPRPDGLVAGRTDRVWGCTRK